MATTNNSNGYNRQQHKMLQQQQHRPTQTSAGGCAADDNDEAATNCSETMSTANEAEEECFGQPEIEGGESGGCHSGQTPGAGAVAASGLCATLASRLEGPGADGGRQAAAGGGGDIQQSDTQHSVRGQGGATEDDPQQTQQRAATAGSPQETDGGCPSELSLASGATQAPPSYGTATRHCATLDATQLRDTLVYQAQLQQQQQAPPDAVFRLGTSSSGQPLYGTLALLAAASGQPVANNYSVSAAADQGRPQFSGPSPMTIESYSHHQPSQLAMRVPRTHSFESQTMGRMELLQSQQQPGRQLMADSQQQPHLSVVGGSLPRSSFVVAHSNGLMMGRAPSRTGDARAAAGQHPNNISRLDNNQGQSCAEFGWHKLQQQQQQVANFKLAPINHVISANGSSQWQQPQANQYYAPGPLLAAAAAVGRQPPLASGEHPAHQLLGSGSSRKSAAGIMDTAPFAWPTTAAAGPPALDRQQQPAMATNRNDGGAPNASWLLQGSAAAASISGGGPATTNVAGGQKQHSINNINNNPPRQMLSIAKALPSRRSDENLERSSRRHQQQQQQQALRKRRRHRSTSGRSVSPAADNGVSAAQVPGEELWPPSLSGRHATDGAASSGPTVLSSKQQQQHQQKRANHKISAHCWLIDSSDDQTYGAAGGGLSAASNYQAATSEGSAPQVGASCGSLHKIPQPPQTHLTVAMMKQALEQQRAKQQATTNSCDRAPSAAADHPNPSSASSSIQPKQAAAAATTLSEDVDLTVSLRTNSFRMERILNRNNDPASRQVGGLPAVGRAKGSRGTIPAARGRHQRALPRSSSPSSSVASSISGHNAQSAAAGTRGTTKRPGTSARLSTLLSLMANLVRRGGASGRHRNIRPPVAPADDEYYPPPAPANSISGSSALLRSGSGAAAQSATLPPYSGSLAISSSSSTSAYATESSHLSSSGIQNPARAAGVLNGSATLATSHRLPMMMNLLKGGHQFPHPHHNQPPPSSASTAGSSLFYSSSGNSGIQMSTSGGSHSYEYCDAAVNETRFVQQVAIGEQSEAHAGSSGSSNGSSRSGGSSSSKNEDHDDDSIEVPEAKSGGRQACFSKNIALTSDNELLSAGSDCAGGFRVSAAAAGGSGDGPAGSAAASGLAARVSQATPSLARRRWWWMSMKDMLCRRPCGRRGAGANSGGGSSTTDSEEGAPAEPVQRYKSLRSRRQGGPSTLKNVLSLAKADKVFRTRLLASLLVSCILIGLIGLLCGLIYSRSVASLYQQNRLGLLIDDSDYDLSWLWPYDTPSSQQLQQSDKPRGYPVFADLQQQIAARNPAEQLIMDGSLRDPLLMIEQSERLAQYQQTMTHLTNLQLANDNFIDLTQLASRLAPPPPPIPDDTPPNLQPSINSSSSSTSYQDANATELHLPSLHLSDSERDLISLTLLSNIHWPLVKWRHQNQQSVANFLSFAVPSAGAVQPHLRSLLSILLLAEAGPELPLAASNNSQLIQFARLNSLLRSSSYHITSCAYQLSSSNRAASVRLRFCDLLMTRYKRMMFTLSQLNHGQLIKLRDPMEPAPTITMDNPSNLADMNHHQHLASSKTLLSFFLDRLALLDVRTVAESTLANSAEEADLLPEDDDSGTGAGTIADDSDESGDGSSAINFDRNLESRAIASILNYPPEVLSAADSSGTRANSKQQATNRWLQNDGGAPLTDLAKLIVGDGRGQRFNNVGSSAAHNDWGADLQQLEARNDEAWRELISNDLLYPWPSARLPRFIAPQSYDLFLHPNLTTRLVLGMVKIGFRLDRPSRFIVVHCDKLNLLDVSLWLKREHVALANRTGGGAESLHRVPIRRVLKNTRLEQIYIELHSSQAGSSIRTAPMERSSPQTSPPLNFGGELPLQPEVHRTSGQAGYFILNISFNKTSLATMKQQVYQAPKAIAAAPEHGLEFVQYIDYFAQSEAELKTMLYTQFEPQNARRLFPCFDEPHLKARFQLNLVHDQSHQVLFNAPKRERVQYSADGAHQMSVFEPTPIALSTYLVAFVVCDTQNIKSLTSRVMQLQPFPTSAHHQASKSEPKNIQVQVLAQFEQLGQAEFASQLVPQLLAFYQSHLNFAYPLDKLDLVAIPRAAIPPQAATAASSGNQQQQQLQISSSQQRLSTMENMGLIWFKANLLLVDTNLISQNLIEQVAMIISHQLAHQYFGNIVSVSQWDDLWLYESLCQYLESVALSAVQPDWRLEEQFVVASIQDTLALEQFNWWPPDNSWPQQQQEQLNSAARTTATNFAEQLIRPAADSYEDDGQLEAADLQSASAVDQQQQLELGALSSSLVDQLGGTKRQEEPFDRLALISSGQPGMRAGAGGELKRSSALLHMLLFNLLPSQEARARLLRRCLSLYRYGTMSRAQFWHQFGEQLVQDGSSERLAFAMDLGGSPRQQPPILLAAASDADQLSSQLDRWHNNHNFTAPTAEHQSASTDQTGTILPSERVVFVRPASASGGGSRRLPAAGRSSGDAHHIHVRRSADRLSQSLELMVDVWLERRGYPLITAYLNRDRIQLRQERFSFAWSNEPGLVDDEPTGGAPDVPLHSDENLHLDAATKLHATNAQQQQQQQQQLEDDSVWPIPLMMVSRLNQKQTRFFWVNKREMELPLQELPQTYSASSMGLDHHASDYATHELSRKGGHLGNVWFKLNVNQSSLVRVNYDERNWEALTELMLKSHYSNHLLSPLDRANLIDDAITLMRCGKLSVGVAMNLTLYLEVGEREFMPWTSALRHLDQMQTLLNQNPLWHRYVLKLMQPISSVIGWKDDGPHLMRKLRRSLFSVALQYGDERTVNKAKQEFKAWFKSGRFIVPNLQELVYVAGVRYGDQQEWFYCWQKYTQLVGLDMGGGASMQNQSDASALDASGDGGQQRDLHGKSSSPLLASVAAAPQLPTLEQNEPNAENEKRQLLTALASTHNTWLLEQFLNYSLDSTKIQPQHLKHVTQTLGKNPVARLYLWRFVRLNWNSLIDRYIDNSFETQSSSSARTSVNNERLKSLRDPEYHQVLATMIMESTKHFVTKLDYEEVKTFFEIKRKQHKLRSYSNGWSSSLERAIQQSLQVIRANIYWRNFIEPKLTKWLSHYDSSIIN